MSSRRRPDDLEAEVLVAHYRAGGAGDLEVIGVPIDVVDGRARR